MEQKPLNQDLLAIDLLIPDKNLFRANNMKEVTNLAIFEPNTDVFHKDGLFSQEIFGQVGSRERIERMGYIDFVLPVFHPLVFMTIIKLGDKYDKIMRGTLSARFDEEEQDFVPDIEGETGFNFFVKHVNKLKYQQTESLKRDNKIKLVERYGKTDSMLTQMLVMPAGLRDYVVDEKGQPSEDDINPLYRTLIGLANRMKTVNVTPDTLLLLDPIRYKIQKAVLDIYKYVESLIDGKKKFIQNKFASRAIFCSTRNVITSIPSRIECLDDENHINFSTTIVGLFQYLKALGPIVFNKVVTRFLMNLMGGDDNKIYLIDPKNLNSVLSTLSGKSKTAWSTSDGVNNTINKFIQGPVFNEYVTIDNKFLYLVLDLGDEVYIGGKDELIPIYEEKVNKDTVNDLLKGALEHIEQQDPNYALRPITYGELFYLSIVDIVSKYPALVTRYPITGHGSIYPSKVYVKTTNNSRHVTAHLQSGETLKCLEYPIFDKLNTYFRSLSVHYTHLGTLGADHDGDALSFTLLFTDEAIEEADKILNTKDFYLKSLGDGYFSPKTNVLDTTLKHLTTE